MNGNALTNMARLGFVFEFDNPRGVVYMRHNTGRDLTDFDVERMGDVFPNHITAAMDDGKRAVAF
jgi:hypothetical protein